MKKSTKFAIVFAPLLLIGCGGGDEENGVQVQPVVNTQDIVAARNFSFDIGETITLSVSEPSVKGALHLYSEAAFTDEQGETIGDPQSLITTIYPDETREFELEINGNWQNLYAQWVPEDSAESERNFTIALDQSNNNYHIDI